MKRSASLCAIALALGATILVPGPSAQAAPTPITACQQITQSGSYVLANNLPSTSGLLAGGDCLVIGGNISFVTVDLAGFSIRGDGRGAGISQAEEGQRGFVVRNGSISNFSTGVLFLDGRGGSLVEGLLVFDCAERGIAVSSGIVRGNIVHATKSGSGIFLAAGSATGNYVTENAGPGIQVDGGTVSGNTAFSNPGGGVRVGSGSTVIGNTARGNSFGITAQCPSNLIDNTATDNGTKNLVLNGADCHNEDNILAT
jgi:parallel beta-helix repeat protein